MYLSEFDDVWNASETEPEVRRAWLNGPPLQRGSSRRTPASSRSHRRRHHRARRPFLLVEERVGGRLVLNQPAGHLEAGESLLDAVVREALEETAWRFEPEHVVGIYLWHSPRPAPRTCASRSAASVATTTASQPLDRRHRAHALAHARRTARAARAHCAARWSCAASTTTSRARRYPLDLPDGSCHSIQLRSPGRPASDLVSARCIMNRVQSPLQSMPPRTRHRRPLRRRRFRRRRAAAARAGYDVQGLHMSNWERTRRLLHDGAATSRTRAASASSSACRCTA